MTEGSSLWPQVQLVGVGERLLCAVLQDAVACQVDLEAPFVDFDGDGQPQWVELDRVGLPDVALIGCRQQWGGSDLDVGARVGKQLPDLGWGGDCAGGEVGVVDGETVAAVGSQGHPAGQHAVLGEEVLFAQVEDLDDSCEVPHDDGERYLQRSCALCDQLRRREADHYCASQPARERSGTLIVTPHSLSRGQVLAP